MQSTTTLGGLYMKFKQLILITSIFVLSSSAAYAFMYSGTFEQCQSLCNTKCDEIFKNRGMSNHQMKEASYNGWRGDCRCGVSGSLILNKPGLDKTVTNFCKRK